MKNSKHNQAAPAKHIPQRTCVACRQVKAKGELVHLVRTPDGGIRIDSMGKLSGRGAYLCRASECWENGLKGNRIEHVLKGSLTQANREKLVEESKELLKGAR